MARTRKRRRLPLGVVASGIVGATIATLIAVSPQLKLQFNRGDVAIDMEQQFRRHGLQYAVAATGPADTILRIKAPSMTKPFAEFLVRDPAKGERLREFGFAAVVFADDQGSRWTYDIASRRFR